MTEVAIPLGLRWPDGAALAAAVALEDLGDRAAGDAVALADQPSPT